MRSSNVRVGLLVALAALPVGVAVLAGLFSSTWIVAVLVGVAGAAASFAAWAAVPSAHESTDDKQEVTSVTQVTLEQKIQRLSDSMQESAKLVEQVSAELDARALTAQQLQEEAEQAKALAAINKQQAEAVQRLVRAGMEQELTETRQDIRRDSVRVAILSFIAGGLVTLLITLLVHPLH